MDRLQEAKQAYAYGYGIGWGVATGSVGGCKDMDECIRACLRGEPDAFQLFTPFGFYAKEFNESVDPDFTWDAYDRGVLRGILSVTRQ